MVENIMPMCSPDLAASIGCPSDLKRHRLIHSQRSIISWPMWLGAYGVVRRPEADDLWFDRAFLALNASVEGLGLALEGDFLAREHLSAGRLVVPFTVQKRSEEHKSELQSLMRI